MIKQKAGLTVMVITFVLLYNFFLTCWFVITSLTCWLLVLLVLGRYFRRLSRRHMIFLLPLLTMRVTVGVTMTSSFHIAHQLLHNQECHNSSQNPQTNAHIMRVAVCLRCLLLAMRVRVGMAFRSWSMWRNGMRNQMEKGIA